MDVSIGVQKSAGKVHLLSEKQVLETVEDLYSSLKASHYLSEKDIKSRSITLRVYVWDHSEVWPHVSVVNLSDLPKPG